MAEPVAVEVFDAAVERFKVAETKPPCPDWSQPPEGVDEAIQKEMAGSQTRHIYGLDEKGELVVYFAGYAEGQRVTEVYNAGLICPPFC